VPARYNVMFFARETAASRFAFARHSFPAPTPFRQQRAANAPLDQDRP
jgi:hypothetical protein